MKLKKFFLAVFSNWLSGMSGSLTVPFTVFYLLVPSVAYKSIFGSLAILAAIVTCYSVWSTEYDRAEREVSKNERPEIIGEVVSITANSFPRYVETGLYTGHFFIHFRVYLCNSRQVPTSLKDVIVDSSESVPSFKCGRIDMFDEDQTLHPGIGRSLAFKIHATIPGDHKEPPTVDLKSMKFWVVDSFGGRHHVPLSNQTKS
jgi:hypothetical protein